MFRLDYDILISSLLVRFITQKAKVNTAPAPGGPGPPQTASCDPPFPQFVNAKLVQF